MLKLFVSGEVKASKLKRPKQAETDFESIKINYIPDPEAYSHASVGTKMPDIVFYDGLNKTGTMAIVLLGEVRPGGTGDFSDDEIGQVTDGLRRLLDKQPFRTIAIGFLTDGNRFFFVRCTGCANDDNDYEYSAVYLGCRGWQVCVLV